MKEFIIETVSQYGYFGIFLLIAIENIFPPIPSEVILLFGGFMTTFSGMNIWGAIISATMGSLLGAAVIYSLGLKLNTAQLERLLDGRMGKILHLRGEDLKRAEKWFLRHGNAAVFLCRFVPIVRSIISLPAGFSRMNLGQFMALTAAGTFIWNTVLIFLGRLAGDAWEKMAVYVDTYALIVLAALFLVALYLSALFIKRRFFKKPGL
ncbi:MAG TPA: DedA family protein [Bacillota bacterium]|jgi:membrane protein DedA with SNARE-associated domain|nr:DedA family protein [Bacillota bacterium]HOB86650.1 DedA family protein [Bacillota bacterium]HOP68695.1 DedA family protein [Bacillota bacterium]HPT33775.1 DedA family protein [Bacillota bacterium]HPZ64995.1 DedA family protein [Bacillota bacterium]